LKAQLLTLVVLALFGCASAALPPAEAPEANYDEDIAHLLELTGAANVGMQMGTYFTQAVTSSIQATNPDVPPRVFEIVDEVVTEVLREGMGAEGGMMDQIVAVYAKHFSHAEVLELTRFYETPLGTKLVEKMPMLVAEGAQVGEAWGREQGPKIQQQLQQRFAAEGFEL